jgi:CRISPR-associated endoribonuclease Cas6
MLQKIILQCQYDEAIKANYNWGSLFHGLLINALPAEVADMLHQSQLRPFSQYILPGPEQQLTWTIGLWDEVIAGHIVQAVMPLAKIELEHKGIILNVIGTQRVSQSEKDYFGQFFASDEPCRRYEIEFLTPCTHKQDGFYALFPSPELIVNSLSRRYCAFMQNVSLDDPAAMEQVARHLRVVRYSLRTAVYYLENTKITGYTGRVTLTVSGPEQLARLAGALLSFGGYSGVGIKTALGMGGVAVKQIGPRLA